MWAENPVIFLLPLGPILATLWKVQLNAVEVFVAPSIGCYPVNWADCQQASVHQAVVSTTALTPKPDIKKRYPVSVDYVRFTPKCRRFGRWFRMSQIDPFRTFMVLDAYLNEC